MNKAWKNIFFLDFANEFTFSFLRLFLIWNPLWTFLVAIVVGHQTWEAVFSRWRLGLYEATVICLLAMAVIRLYLFLENSWFSKRTEAAPSHGTGWYLFFLGFLVPPGLYLAFHLLVRWINFTYDVGAPIPLQVPWKYFETQIFWVWLLILTAFLFRSWLDLKERAVANQLRAEALEKERLQALLTNLKDQMNPHFLFNVLNTVAALIHADPAKAEQVVVKLSSLYQGVLRATRKANHPLAQELEFCRNYLDIEKARFGKRLNAEFKIEKGLDPAQVQVPVLLLQPFVENAVKHGLSSRASGGKIWVEASLKAGKILISVEDDGVGLGQSPYSGSGTAVENCRKRLELSYGPEGRLEIKPREGGGTRVAVTIPAIAPESTEEDKK